MKNSYFVVNLKREDGLEYRYPFDQNCNHIEFNDNYLICQHIEDRSSQTLALFPHSKVASVISVEVSK